jgi:hypothetical protein
VIEILYRNHRGEVGTRRIEPGRVEYGSSKWHPKPQWLLHARDVERGVDRTFALRDVLRWDGVDVRQG